MTGSILCIYCGSPSSRSAKRKRLVESSEDEEMPEDSESQHGDDESESPKPVR